MTGRPPYNDCRDIWQKSRHYHGQTIKGIIYPYTSPLLAAFLRIYHLYFTRRKEWPSGIPYYMEFQIGTFPLRPSYSIAKDHLYKSSLLLPSNIYGSRYRLLARSPYPFFTRCCVRRHWQNDDIHLDAYANVSLTLDSMPKKCRRNAWQRWTYILHGSTLRCANVYRARIHVAPRQIREYCRFVDQSLCT